MTTTAPVKTILQDVILITYDIPATAAKARREFLKKAREIGAEAHTDSVYLMPYSDQTMALANNLQAAGHVVVWRAHQPDPEKAAQITENYEKALKARCDFIQTRLGIASNHVTAGRLVLAQNMGPKTGRLLKQVAAIAQHFNPPWLGPRLEKLVTEWKGLYDYGKQ